MLSYFATIFRCSDMVPRRLMLSIGRHLFFFLTLSLHLSNSEGADALNRTTAPTFTDHAIKASTSTNSAAAVDHRSSLQLASTINNHSPNIPFIPTENPQQYEQRQAKFQTFLQEQMIATGEQLNSHDKKQFEKWMRQNAMNISSTYAQQYARNKTNGFINRLGKVKLDFTLNEQLKIKDYAIDYRRVVVESFSHQLFLQAGSKQSSEDTSFNLGAGYRYFSSTFMTGFNSFYDRNYLIDVSRLTFGIEAATNYGRMIANYYRPVSDWSDYNPNTNKTYFQAKAASGFDISVSTTLPFYPALSAEIEYFNWQGEHVDIYSSFDKNKADLKNSSLLKNPEGLTTSIQWQPIPLLSTAIYYSQPFSGSKYFSGELSFSWSFDRSLSTQLLPQKSEGHRLLSGMREAFVKRQDNIIVQVREKSQAKQPVVLELDINVMSGLSITINPKIQLTHSVVNFQWKGTGKSLLNARNIRSPTLKTPPTGTGLNQYTLQLVATDSIGDIYASNVMTVHIKDSYTLELSTEPLFKNKLSWINKQAAESTQIYWRIRGLDYSNSYPDQFTWHDPNNFLINSKDRNPILKPGPLTTANSITLDVTLPEGTITFLVEIQISPKVTVEWFTDKTLSQSITQQLILQGLKPAAQQAGWRVKVNNNGIISDFSPTQWQWQNTSDVFVQSTDKYPELNHLSPTGYFEPELHIDDKNNGKHRFILPVKVTPQPVINSIDLNDLPIKQNIPFILSIAHPDSNRLKVKMHTKSASNQDTLYLTHIGSGVFAGNITSQTPERIKLTPEINSITLPNNIILRESYDICVIKTNPIAINCNMATLRKEFLKKNHFYVDTQQQQTFAISGSSNNERIFGFIFVNRKDNSMNQINSLEYQLGFYSISTTKTNAAIANVIYSIKTKQPEIKTALSFPNAQTKNLALSTSDPKLYTGNFKEFISDIIDKSIRQCYIKKPDHFKIEIFSSLDKRAINISLLLKNDINHKIDNIPIATTIYKNIMPGDLFPSFEGRINTFNITFRCYNP